MGAMFSAASGKLVEEFMIAAWKGLTRRGAVKKNSMRLNAEEVVSPPEEAMGVTGLIVDDLGPIGYAVLIRIKKDLDVSGAGNSELPVI
tara:strand:- start:719 stop:985 length:267 start_codon:yes stop_codon:yes gene_type:complete